MKKQNQSLADIVLILSIEYIFNDLWMKFSYTQTVTCDIVTREGQFYMKDNGLFLFNNSIIHAHILKILTNADKSNYLVTKELSNLVSFLFTKAER